MTNWVLNIEEWSMNVLGNTRTELNILQGQFYTCGYYDAHRNHCKWNERLAFWVIHTRCLCWWLKGFTRPNISLVDRSQKNIHLLFKFGQKKMQKAWDFWSSAAQKALKWHSNDWTRSSGPVGISSPGSGFVSTLFEMEFRVFRKSKSIFPEGKLSAVCASKDDTEVPCICIQTKFGSFREIFPHVELSVLYVLNAQVWTRSVLWCRRTNRSTWDFVVLKKTYSVGRKPFPYKCLPLSSDLGHMLQPIVVQSCDSVIQNCLEFSGLNFIHRHGIFTKAVTRPWIPLPQVLASVPTSDSSIDFMIF